MADIVGTNFRVASAAVVNPPRAFNTVAVTVGGVPAEAVFVPSTTLLRVRIPDFRGDPNPAIVDDAISRVAFPAVDVVITNLDDDGVAIAGETVTAAAAYTYEQPLIRAPQGDPPLLQVFRELLRLLKRQVISRTAMQTHTDFGEGTGILFTELSEHPSVGLQMNIQRDPEYSYFDNEKIIIPMGGGVFREYDGTKTYMLVCPVTLSSKNPFEAHHLNAALIDAVAASVWLRVAPDPAFPGGTLNNYPLELVQPPEQIGGSNRVNITAFQAVLRVRGVPVVRGDPLTEQLFQISTISLSTTNTARQNVQTAPV